MKFPPKAIGALTLGLGQTKDATVQAAMRLRQLGTSQSVLFMATPEVHRSILDVCEKPWQSKIDSGDVIRWIIDNTCAGIEQLQPLYYSQGKDFCARMQAVLSHPDACDRDDDRDIFIKSIIQKEKLTLADMYGLCANSKNTNKNTITEKRLKSYADDLENMRKLFQDNGTAVHASVLQEVEQQREVTKESESVRQLKLPPKFSSLKFPGLHDDLKQLLHTGHMPPTAANCSNFIPAFDALSKSVAGLKHKVHMSEKDPLLFVTTEFQRTVRMHATEPTESYLRPVQYILWCPLINKAVIVIPEEAEAIISYMRAPGYSNTHLLYYAAPVTKKMLAHFNSMNFYSIPPLHDTWSAPVWLKIQVGIFSGRLYFEWDEYKEIHEFLGILAPHVDTSLCKQEKAIVQNGDFAAQKKQKLQPIAQNPLAFINEWISNRRKGKDIGYTPMGYIVQGNPLDPTHPFFRSSPISNKQRTKMPLHLHEYHKDGSDKNLEENSNEFYEVCYEIEDSEKEEGCSDIDTYSTDRSISLRIE